MNRNYQSAEEFMSEDFDETNPRLIKLRESLLSWSTSLREMLIELNLPMEIDGELNAIMENASTLLKEVVNVDIRLEVDFIWPEEEEINTLMMKIFQLKWAYRRCQQSKRADGA